MDNMSTRGSMILHHSKGIKRKASPEKDSPRKIKRVAKACNNSVQNGILEREKCQIREDGETSFSVDTEKESSSNTSDVCSTWLSKTSTERKAAHDGAGSCRKKRRTSDLNETQRKTTEDTVEETTEDLTVNVNRFEDKYTEQNLLGEGGYGSVFAGYRKADHLPVAIKHIPKDDDLRTELDENGKELPVEVIIMLKLTGESVRAPVSLLDWYDLDQELILVLERPVPSEDLYSYLEVNGGSLEEEKVKVIMKQLVDAALDLHNMGIFHRDIKLENILIETGSDVPHVRLIDFGLSCFFEETSCFNDFFGTAAFVQPEYLSNFTYKAGPTTVWQLGLVMFEALHKNARFSTIGFLNRTLKISNELSNNCRNFLLRCLTIVPDQRATLEQLQHHPWLK
uniref:non-specific serine/threonine protein kinase n=2 Tax=Monopterus albus TaxID=43700 RepID=A0A3Q3JH89_MONAL|nr:serine/threonine-protein kinase pim-1-like isoform X2 [Monopterus albus]